MFYLGIDVAKAKLDCCLLVDIQTLKRKNKTVANKSQGFKELLEWLQRQHISPEEVHVIMEGTGVYHEQAAFAFHDASVHVSIVNPAYVRDFARGLAVRTKTDGVDSLVLARYGLLVQPKCWTPPSIEARQLQSLLSRRAAIAQDLQRERNRQEKALATETLDVVQQSIQKTITFLEKQLEQIQKDIDDHINRNPKLKEDLKLLQSIPAVGERVGNTLLAVMHSHSFTSAEQMAAYLGLIPVEHQSGSSVQGRARLSKAGPAHVRAILYMAAVVATKYNPHVKVLYERLLVRGKPKMAALGAAMRKLVHLCFGVIKNQTPYQANYLASSA